MKEQNEPEHCFYIVNTPFALHQRKIENNFILREINNILGITFSRRNVHFSHPLVYLRNYHANAPSITYGMSFSLLKSLLCLWKNININNTAVYIF